MVHLEEEFKYPDLATKSGINLTNATTTVDMSYLSTQ